MHDRDLSRLAPRSRLVHRLARESGFALVGVAKARPSAYEPAVRQWILEGRAGEMGYLSETMETRLDPRKLLHGARSVICVADFYESGGGGARSEEQRAKSGERGVAKASEPSPMGTGRCAARHGARGRIARYAWGNDYHRVMKKRLHHIADALASRFPDEMFRCCVDTAPLLEREHAARAGLGWVGKNTLLIHPSFGSWMLLGQIVTTLAIQSSEEAHFPGFTVPPMDHCGTCTRCIDACPTNCITPYSVDASRCISYLTLEHRSEIDPDLHESMGDWIAGCDVCQEVCPFNQQSEERRAWSVEPMASEQGFSGGPLPILRDYRPRRPAPAIPVLEMLGWTTENRQTAFSGSALKRIKLDMAKRNALIAAGNHLIAQHTPAIWQRIRSIAVDPCEAEMIRRTAQQVLERLGPQPGRSVDAPSDSPTHSR